MNEQEPIETTEKLFGRTRTRKRRNWIRIGIPILIIAVFTVLFWTASFSRLENLVLDGYFRRFPLQKNFTDITLIGISEISLDEVGAWPWPRRYLAVIARLLDQWGAASIVFDLDLSEKTDPMDDADFAQALAGLKTPVYFSVDLKPVKERRFWLHGFPVTLEKAEGKKAWARPLPEFEKSAKGIGHRVLSEDVDGVLRRFDPFLTNGGEEYSFFPLTAAYGNLKKPVPAFGFWEPFSDEQGKVLIPWGYKKDAGPLRVDCSDIIHSYYGIVRGMTPVIQPEKFKDKICLIGLTATGHAEYRTTPLAASSPDLASYAQVLGAALNGSWMRPASFSANLIVLIGIGLLAACFFLVLRSPISFAAGLLLGLGWLGVSAFLFWEFHIWFYVTYPLILILTLFIFFAIYVQFSATRERSALFHLATRDGLTDLYVIRHFRLIMNQIVREAAARKESLSIILLDIDHFKNINDTYGHPAGDMVLKNVAEILTKYIRKKRPFSQIDFAARYGGEEFIIMLRKAGLAEASGRVGERLRKKIEEAKFEWGGKIISVTASFGVAFLHPGENVPDPMVHRADAALYKAKKSGRNRVCPETD